MRLEALLICDRVAGLLQNPPLKARRPSRSVAQQALTLIPPLAGQGILVSRLPSLTYSTRGIPANSMFYGRGSECVANCHRQRALTANMNLLAIRRVVNSADVQVQP